MSLYPWLPLWLLFAPLVVAITVWLRGRRTLVTIGGHLGTLVLLGLTDAATRRWVILLDGEVPSVPFEATLLYFADVTIAAYATIVVGTALWMARRRLVEAEARAIAARAQLTAARVRWLETQLQPHFLFNALSSVLELAEESRPAAQRAIAQLTTLLDTALEDRVSSEVALAEELETVGAYLAIQRLRFSDWLVIEEQVDPAALRLFVPRLLLQPIVENAVRHGLAGRTRRGRILITAGPMESARLRITVTDDGVGLRAPHVHAREGIGLSNVRRRLAELFGDDFLLTVERAHTDAPGTTTIVEIPAREAARTPAVGVPAVTSASSNGQNPRGRAGALVRQPLVAVTIAWVAWGVFWAHQSYGYLMLRDRLGALSYSDVLRRDMGSALLWVPISAALLALVGPIVRRSVPVRVVILAALGPVVASAHAAAFAVTIASAPVGEMIGSLLPLNLLLYGALVLALFRSHIEEWIRRRELALLHDQARATQAGLEAMTARAEGAAMRRDLTAASAALETDLPAAERILTGLSERLRRQLDASRHERASAGHHHTPPTLELIA